MRASNDHSRYPFRQVPPVLIKKLYVLADLLDLDPRVRQHGDRRR